jgi:hypothetical protein
MPRFLHPRLLLDQEIVCRIELVAPQFFLLLVVFRQPLVVFLTLGATANVAARTFYAIRLARWKVHVASPAHCSAIARAMPGKVLLRNFDRSSFGKLHASAYHVGIVLPLSNRILSGGST